MTRVWGRAAGVTRATYSKGALCVVALVMGASLLRAAPLIAATSTNRVPVIDLHVDLPYRSVYKGRDFSQGSGQFVADRLEKAGVRGVVLPLFVPEDAAPAGRTRAQFETAYAQVFAHILRTPPYSLPGCAVEQAGGKKRAVSTWLAFEGAGPLGADEMEIRKWVLRGVRSFGMVHSVSNELAESSGRGPRAPRRDRGLSEEGRKFVSLVYRAGGLIDVSHASDASTDEAIRIARSLGKPILATHSNARALAPHARNLEDAQIQAIAASGGIVGVNFHQPFLRAAGNQKAGISDVVAQIEHLRDVGGIDAVAIGSDFEGGISAALELSGADDFPKLAEALLARGFTREEVKKIFFGNAWRVLCGAR